MVKNIMNNLFVECKYTKYCLRGNKKEGVCNYPELRSPEYCKNAKERYRVWNTKYMNTKNQNLHDKC